MMLAESIGDAATTGGVAAAVGGFLYTIAKWIERRADVKRENGSSLHTVDEALTKLCTHAKVQAEMVADHRNITREGFTRQVDATERLADVMRAHQLALAEYMAEQRVRGCPGEKNIADVANELKVFIARAERRAGRE